MFRVGHLVEVGVSFRGVKGKNGKRFLKPHLVSLTLRDRIGSFLLHDIQRVRKEEEAKHARDGIPKRRRI